MRLWDKGGKRYRASSRGNSGGGKSPRGPERKWKKRGRDSGGSVARYAKRDFEV